MKEKEIQKRIDMIESMLSRCRQRRHNLCLHLFNVSDRKEKRSMELKIERLDNRISHHQEELDSLYNQLDNEWNELLKL